MKETKLYDQVESTSIQSTVFSDGMVVNANDLETAMQYPLELIQVLIRAYFGCGIVCGLELSTADEKGECENGKYSVTIGAGVALDCHGFPLHLRKSVTIPLLPDPCMDQKPDCVCIAISRTTTPGSPRDCGCDNNGKSQTQYARENEAVRIKAFPIKNSKNCKSGAFGNIHLCACEDFDCCGSSRDASASDKATEDAYEPHRDSTGTTADSTTPGLANYCECIKGCPNECCGESWVLIGCVQIDGDGITDEHIHNEGKQYIKPIQCICQCQKKATAETDDDSTTS